MGKVRISNLIIVFLIIALMPIYSFGWGWVNFSRNITLILCGIYTLIHWKDIRWNNMLPVIGYIVVICLSSYINKEQLNVAGLLRHVMLIFEIVAIPEIISRRKSVAYVTKTALYLLLIYWIISVILSFYIGVVPYGSGDVYFVGNKFNVAYLCVMVILLYGINELEVFKKTKSRAILYLIWGVSIIACVRINAYTGVVMMSISLAWFLIHYVKLNFIKTNQHWNIIHSPCFLLILVILSGAIVAIIAGIFSIPLISNIVSTINKTGTINSRLMIYSYLGEIIRSKPLLGYGFNTDIVKVTYAENAQNGLMKIIIENGLVGAFFFLEMVWSRLKYSKSVKGMTCDWILIWIVAYIVSAVIEITYSYHFIFILELFFLQCIETKGERENG